MTIRGIVRSRILRFLFYYVFLPSVGILLLGNIDYCAVKRRGKPFFTGGGVGCADGGTVEYTGLGYWLVKHAGFTDRPRPEWAHGDGWAHDKGQTIVYWFPWLWPFCKSEVKTVIREDWVAIEDKEALLRYKQKHGID